MGRIEITDLNEDTTVTEEAIKHVKGGGRTLGALDRKVGTGYTEVEWTYITVDPKTGGGWKV